MRLIDRLVKIEMHILNARKGPCSGCAGVDNECVAHPTCRCAAGNRTANGGLAEMNRIVVGRGAASSRHIPRNGDIAKIDGIL